MTPIEEYIIGLSSEKLIRFITVEKSLHSAKELSIAANEVKRRGLDPDGPKKNEDSANDENKLFKELKNDYYKIDDQNDNSYMSSNIEESMRLSRTYNPFTATTVSEADMNKTTFLMTIASIVPILVGMIIWGLFEPGQVNLAMGLTIIWFIDAIICLIDCSLLKNHNYDIGKLWIPAFLLTPLYLSLRARLLKEKNYHTMAWIMLTILFIIMCP